MSLEEFHEMQAAIRRAMPEINRGIRQLSQQAKERRKLIRECRKLFDAHVKALRK